MTSQHHQSTLLIAAREPSQGKALAEILTQLRPDAAVYQLGAPDSPASPTLGIVAGEGAEAVRTQAAGLRADHPRLALIVIAPAFDEATLAAAAEFDAKGLIQSPCDIEPLLELIASQERKLRFLGRSAELETDELLRLHARARSTGVLYFVSSAGTGRIHLADGHPVDARCGERTGASAVEELLAWTDAKLTWMAGHSAKHRSIIARLDDMLSRDSGPSGELAVVHEAPREVLAKLAKLAKLDDIVGAYLLRESEILVGHSEATVDELVLGRALTRLSLVLHDMETIQGEHAGPEIQAVMGDHRLVVDRIGPSRFGFQVGVVVKQGMPVCKSLRRLIRQMDRSFRRSLSARARRQGSSPPGGPARSAAALNRVA